MQTVLIDDKPIEESDYLIEPLKELDEKNLIYKLYKTHPTSYSNQLVAFADAEANLNAIEIIKNENEKLKDTIFDLNTENTGLKFVLKECEEYKETAIEYLNFTNYKIKSIRDYFTVKINIYVLLLRTALVVIVVLFIYICLLIP